jgi:uncharacterized protein (UPF0261 family)
MKTIVILGTFDTKGEELAALAEMIRERGGRVLKIDAGSGVPAVTVDIPAHEVAGFGGENWRKVLARRDRGEWVALIARAAAAHLKVLAQRGEIHGLISLGGGGGTAIATAAMRSLPIGFPKLMVSTLASGNVAPYVGTSDIVMMPAVVDVAGMNRISRVIFKNAAGAICGMVQAADRRREESDRPVVVASMFGNTTQCVNEARRFMEAAGSEVLVFHATGQGGRAMESLIDSGLVSGVLDITTTELADELVGGILSAGQERLSAAGRAGVPAVIAPGCLDMVNFGEPQSIPDRFAGRLFYQHNPQVTLMRTSPAECAELGRILAEKINAYSGEVKFFWPRGGISLLSAPSQPFYDPEADAALLGALKSNLKRGIELQEMDCAINDPAFAKACAASLISFIAGRCPSASPPSTDKKSVGLLS